MKLDGKLIKLNSIRIMPFKGKLIRIKSISKRFSFSIFSEGPFIQLKLSDGDEGQQDLVNQKKRSNSQLISLFKWNRSGIGHIHMI